ncbi:hypothetical protein BDZ85DRAFT_280043 [Elsinoe ampelina]|uniref:Uncharacterized protein n=1 Tax=Elsinoe ampelina TaxID=302913 RepID=A0A6A6GGI7_9PEZI|nr:hypothetical protein BDZ85DRAFT_280043 [Elsinoe ampelina]
MIHTEKNAFQRLHAVVGVQGGLQRSIRNRPVGYQSDQLTERIDIWAKGMVEDIWSNLNPQTKEDGTAMGVFGVCQGTQELKDRIVPKVVEHADRTAFFLAFLAEYYVNGGAIDDPEHYDHIIVSLVPLAIPEFSLAELTNIQITKSSIDVPNGALEVKNLVGSIDLSWLFCALLEHKHVDNAVKLFKAIAESAIVLSGMAPQVDYQTTLPFLSSISKSEHMSPTPEQLLEVMKRYLPQILVCFIRYFVKTAPPRATWAMSRLSCNCVDCSYISDFLANPGQQFLRHRGATKSMRHHIHIMLDRTSCSHETTDRGRWSSTMVITKRSQHGQAAYTIWQQRADRARQAIADIRQSWLQQVLGDSYAEIIDLKIPQRYRTSSAAPTAEQRAASEQRLHRLLTEHAARGGQAARHVQEMLAAMTAGPSASGTGTAMRQPRVVGTPVAGRPPGSTVPAKRPIEVVDLTGD